MKRTIEYYDENAKEFCKSTVNADMSFCRDKFLKYLKPQSRILDAGCGSGRDSKAFLESGYDIVAFDASIEVCKYASKFLGREVSLIKFEDIEYKSEFDGIWACASLLHIEKRLLPGILDKLHTALKEKGVIYASFKCGDNERWIGDRFFSDFTEDDCCKLFEENGRFKVLECFVTLDVRDDRQNEKWVNVIGMKI